MVFEFEHKNESGWVVRSHLVLCSRRRWESREDSDSLLYCVITWRRWVLALSVDVDGPVAEPEPARGPFDRFRLNLN